MTARTSPHNRTETLILRAKWSPGTDEAAAQAILDLATAKDTLKLRLHPSVSLHIFTATQPLSQDRRASLHWPWLQDILIELGKPLILDPVPGTENPREHIHALAVLQGPEPRTVLTIRSTNDRLSLTQATIDLAQGTANITDPALRSQLDDELQREEDAIARTISRLAHHLSDPETVLQNTNQPGRWRQVRLSHRANAELAAEPTDVHPGGQRLPLPNWRPSASTITDPARAISSCRTMRWILRHLPDDPSQTTPDMLSITQPDHQGAVADLVLDPDTKRIIISHIQLEKLLTADHDVPSEILADLRWPFDDAIFIETDHPLTLLPDDSPDLLLQAIMLWPGQEQRHLGYVFTRRDQLYVHTYLTDPRSAHAELLSSTGSDPAPDTGMAIARLLSYMTAKGIEIVEQSLPRAQRRLLERKKLTNPWHIIRVSPTIRRDNDDHQPEPGQGSAHGHRYDVGGHLRFGRHRLTDGSYRITKEWVRAHQRGLRHELYIPAIRRYQGPNDIQEVLRRLNREARSNPINTFSDNVPSEDE